MAPPKQPRQRTATESQSRPDKKERSHNVSRHVMPVGPRILVRILKAEDRSSGGLFLPSGAKEDAAEATYATVVEVARAPLDEDDDKGFGRNVSGIPLGSNVLLPKTSGTPVPWDEKLRILDVKDVLAVVEEIGLDDAH